ncbi:MAG: glutathione S-transferase [Pseudomonadales bacterium]
MPGPKRPVLYSFRRCPYAIRARMALCYAGIAVELREVLLRDKPAAMLAASAKGTVPVLVLESGQVLDESIDIMAWALAQHDPDDWRRACERSAAAMQQKLIAQCDGEFKHWLDRYKYADRFPAQSAEYYRAKAGHFLLALDTRLQQQAYLLGTRPCRADIAIFPFLRQFAAVDRAWFEASQYTSLKRWLQTWLAANTFAAVMRKYPPWHEGAPGIAEDWAP